MKDRRLCIVAAAILFIYSSGTICASHTAANTIITCDIVIYGGTPAGCAAAFVAASQTAPRAHVCLVEPSPYLGGMLTAGGIGLRDTADFASVFGSPASFASRWAKANADHYNTSQYVLQPDVVVGNASLWAVLHSVAPSNPISIYLNEGLVEDPHAAVTRDGTAITSITTAAPPNLNPTDPTDPIPTTTIPTTTWHAKVFLDATYEGDLIRASNVSHTYGREARASYNESLAGVQPFNHFQNFLTPVDPFYPGTRTVLPYVSADTLPPIGSADTALMPYSFRACLTRDPATRVPFFPPDNYTSNDFEFLQRYIASFNATGGPDITQLVGVLPYMHYPTTLPLKYDLCEGGAGPEHQTSPFTTDQPDINAGYVTASYRQRLEIAQRVRCEVVVVSGWWVGV